jgi:hypothetical protein
MAVFALAAFSLALALIWRFTPMAGFTREPTVAWLVNAQNCQWTDGDLAGDMQAGKVLKLERGLAEIQFQCGARALLEGPATLELLSGKSAQLRRGKLTARAPGPAVGFEILTPEGKVIDLGTEFGMAVSDSGAADVYVVEGKVEAYATNANHAPIQATRLTQNEAAQIVGGTVARKAYGGDRFARAIRPPPSVVPRTLRLLFDRPIEGSIADAGGLGTGLKHRLPGTGTGFAGRDGNLLLDQAKAHLRLTTTRSDINHQVCLDRGEYLGVRLSDLGFSGNEDFAVTAVIPNTPDLEDYGQFGLYAGATSDRNIRGGLIKWGPKEAGLNTQFLVNNNGGTDSDVYKVGLLSPGTDLRLTLTRVGGKYSLTVENLTEGGASTLTIRHPEWLDGDPALQVGLFGANPYSDVRKTLIVKEFSVTVLTIARELPL